MLSLEFSFKNLHLSHFKNKFATSALVRHDRRDGAMTQAEEKAGVVSSRDRDVRAAVAGDSAPGKGSN
jgi:hypothetical protein